MTLASPVRISGKSKETLLLLSWLLGCLGVDRFYRGQVGIGILKLLTFGGCGIWALVDNFIYMLGDLPTDAGGAVIVDQHTLQLIRPGATPADTFGAATPPAPLQSSARFCASCGAPVDAGLAFCGTCGAKR